MNRLAAETSPYLLQHADNPVDWYPWGEEALARARGRGQADPALDRLRRLPLVPRDGARVVRGRGDRRADERALRQRQGRPRGAARPRRALHGGRRRADRPRRLADDRLPHAGRASRSTAAPTSRPSRGTACRASARCSTAIAEAWRDRRDDVDAQRRAARRGGAALGARSGPSTEPLTADAARRRRARARARASSPPTAASGRAPKFPPAPALELLLRRGRRRGARDGAHDARRDGGRRHVRPRSAAASTATRSTSAGSCRTSRRCSTTTPCSRPRTCTRGS